MLIGSTLKVLPSGSWHLSVTESVVLPPATSGVRMPDAQLANKLSPRQIVRPRCPVCDAHMETLRIASGRPGFEHRTLRCSKCRLICEVQAPSDPIDSCALRWLSGELKPPR